MHITSTLAGLATFATFTGALLAAACSSTPDPSTTPAAGNDAGGSSNVPRDAGQTVYASDAAFPIADSAPPQVDADTGPLGSVDNPANSCAEIHFEYPAMPSGTYQISELGEAPYATYCDMTTEGGGWTRITGDFSPGNTVLVLGNSGRIMLKCSDDGTAAVVSPLITDTTWQWAGHSFLMAGGDWTANGATVPCAIDSEYAATSCATWWGFGCDQGAGGAKVIPGIKGALASATCADTTTVHTSGAFSICGSDDYAHYSVFVRAH